jgi:hypothetical protein
VNPVKELALSFTRQDVSVENCSFVKAANEAGRPFAQADVPQAAVDVKRVQNMLKSGWHRGPPGLAWRKA